MKTKLYFLVLNLSLCGLAAAQPDYSALVDPFIGTGGHGHTFPGATLPFGMVQVSPDTRIDNSWDGCGGYHYSDSVLYGFSHTHLSGTGVPDYGDILLLPFNGRFDPEQQPVGTFIHRQENASPGYYSVFLQNSKIQVELTATLRTAMHKYIFPAGDSSRVLLDLRHRDKVLDAGLQILDSVHVSGFRRSSGWARDQVVYFYLEFSQPVISCDAQVDSKFLAGVQGTGNWEGKDLRAAFRFKTNGRDPLYVRVGISPVSTEGAKQNLESESSWREFNTIRTVAKKIWNAALGKIEVLGGRPDQQKIFYTALYHCFVVPNTFSDVDGSYRGRDGKVHTGQDHVQYTVFSLWDTFRALHPLESLIDSARTLDFIQTFLNQYKEGGLLPVWELAANETECMIGYHAIPVILDAVRNGITGFDQELAFEAMKKSAESRDRYGLGSYMDQGYLSIDDEPESVSKTLEYAFDDWCIAQMAAHLGRQGDAARYYRRCQSWKNLFDKSTGFMRPKKNGDWLSPFDPYRVDNNYTEANAWQYAFFVPQDIPGLISAFGGAEKFAAQLDSLFTTHSKTTGRDQSDISGMIGQYAHGNEPSHHMAYLYDYAGQPWKTQARVRQILDEQYAAAPDGLSGNEDCGQMSAWYIWSAMGLYPVTPGSGWYAIGSPLFPEVRMHMENGKTFTIHGVDVSDKNKYIQSATFNFEPYTSVFVNSEQIRAGGVLDLLMGDKPMETWGIVSPPATMPDTVPLLLTNPVVHAASEVFNGTMKFVLSSPEGAEIRYTLDGKDPSLSSPLYTEPVSLNANTTVKAVAFEGNRVSNITRASFHKIPHPDWTVQIDGAYNPQYTAGGDAGIIDGLRGNENWRKGGWQGYQGQDFEAVVDMKNIQTIKELGAGFLQDTRSWILMPTEVIFSVSNDGTNFRDVLKLKNTVPDTLMETRVKDLTGRLSVPVKARYVKVHAKNYGELPDWHLGAGGLAFIFVDELIIR